MIQLARVWFRLIQYDTIIGMNEEDIVDFFTKHRYYDKFDEKRWREEMEEHPLLMTKPPEDPNKIPPLVEAMRQLKYSEDCNTPEELAKQYKLDGNENFKSKKFEDAIASYSKGLSYIDRELDETAELKSILYSNRAACYVMLKRFQEAIDDCKNALRINPKNMRARQRMEESLYKLKS